MIRLFEYLPLLIVFLVLSVALKGLALWHAGRRGEGWWFVALLVINTVGLLELYYLFVRCRLQWQDLFKK